MYPDLVLDGPVPIHEQITTWMRDNIRSSRWDSGYKLKAESDLASELGVSRGTVRKAIETLIEETLLQRIHGKGTFVRETPFFEQQATGRLAGFSSDLLARGIPFTTEVPFCEVTNPSREIAHLLRLQPTDQIFHMRRIRRIGRHANILIENHIVYDYCVGIETCDFSRNQFYITLENEFNIVFDWARRTYKAQKACQEVADCLDIPVGSPVMYLEELYHNTHGTPIEFTRAWFNGDLFHITTLIKREDEKRDTPGFYR